jgi:arylsulfatase A-like enzyme
LAALACGVLAAVSHVPVMTQAGPQVQLILVVDGLRPDYITADVMPRLYALGQRGVFFDAHHSVFPTVTRVNSSSISTGSYPETHGLMSNTMYSEKAFPTRGLNTSDYRELEAMEKAEGHLLTAPSLGQALEKAGKKLLVISAGSSGSAKLLNHPVSAGAVVHPELVVPASLGRKVVAAVGEGPKEGVPNVARNRWATDVYLSLGLGELASDVTAIWFGDPDATAHAKGIGSVEARGALTAVDAEIGRIEDALRAKGVLERTNILVTSDHGFSTHTGELRLASLVAPFAKPLPDGSPDIVVAEGSVNFRGAGDETRVRMVVEALQKRPEVGAVFTRPRSTGDTQGVVPGTLSFNVARWNHSRAGDILISGNWSDQKNAAGYAGYTTQGGVAGHGTSSPYDVHNTLIAAGPAFRERVKSDVPTSNVDLAPTLLKILGLPIPSSMTGRSIDEALRSGPPLASVVVERRVETAKTADGTYQVDAHVSVVSGRTYLDYTRVTRAPAH